MTLRDLIKLSILSNHAEYPKELAPIVIHATPFYNSKISIPNGSASSFGEDDFSSGETGQSLDTVQYLEAVKHLETIKYLETIEHLKTAKHLEMSMSMHRKGGIFEFYEGRHTLSIPNLSFLDFDTDAAFEAQVGLVD